MEGSVLEVKEEDLELYNRIANRINPWTHDRIRQLRGNTSNKAIEEVEMLIRRDSGHTNLNMNKSYDVKIYWLIKTMAIRMLKQPIDTDWELLAYKEEQKQERQAPLKKNYEELIVGWLGYFFFMFFATMFRDRVVGYIIITIWFAIWRASNIAKYNKGRWKRW